MVEQVIQQPQAQLEQAQITAVAPMKEPASVVLLRDRAQVNDPHVSQASGDHQPFDPVRITQVTAIQLEPPAFLVRKEGLNVHPLAISVAGALDTGHIADQVNGFLIASPPPGDDHHRAIGHVGEQDSLAENPLATLSS